VGTEVEVEFQQAEAVFGPARRKSRVVGAALTKGMLVVEGERDKGIEKCIVVRIGYTRVEAGKVRAMSPSFVFESRALLGRAFFICELLTVILLKVLSTNCDTLDFLEL